MASFGDDLWSEVASCEQDQPPIPVVYRRRRPDNCNADVQIRQCHGGNRPSIVLNRKVSWKRSLSTRGRSSIFFPAGTDYRPPLPAKDVNRKPRRPLPNGRSKRHGRATAPDFSKERAYFQEVDSFELLEESPSPKKCGTWAMGPQQNVPLVHDLPSILLRWLLAKKLTYSSASSGSRPKVLHSPIRMPMESIMENVPLETSEKTRSSYSVMKQSETLPWGPGFTHSGSKTCKRSTVLAEGGLDNWDLEEAVRNLSLEGEKSNSFGKLLLACGQTVLVRQSEVLSKYCDLNIIVKIGEGTYGEAFRVGGNVCKIVPIDGDLRVNGEVQKRSAEVLEEVLLSWTLNSLRGQEGQVVNQNTCSNFIETKGVRVCHGAYDPALVSAWEDWDQKHGSENDHPKDFSEEQRYILFVLADGGTDLENFVLLNFEEAQSLLVQVTGALAVAEAACEFEHRDLHWGNILLARNGTTTAKFVLQGREMQANTSGLSVSIIDFTLSRINTGEAIFFLDLSADPELFEGPKGDKQAETYRKMKEVTQESWEGSYPKTNVLWLQYLVDILLLKKTFKRTSKDERVLRSFRKNLNSYKSAKEALSDPFFGELWVS